MKVSEQRRVSTNNQYNNRHKMQRGGIRSQQDWTLPLSRGTKWGASERDFASARQSLASLNPKEDTQPPRLPSDVRELRALFADIETCIQLRAEYMHGSLQCPHDNPKDQDHWDVYPNSTSGKQTAKNPEKDTIDTNDPTENTRKDTSTEHFNLNDVHIPTTHPAVFSMDDHGVFQIFASQSDCETQNVLVQVPSLLKFYQDHEFITALTADGPAKSFAFRRLQFLESKFQMYSLLNS